MRKLSNLCLVLLVLLNSLVGGAFVSCYLGCTTETQASLEFAHLPSAPHAHACQHKNHQPSSVYEVSKKQLELSCGETETHVCSDQSVSIENLSLRASLSVNDLMPVVALSVCFPLVLDLCLDSSGDELLLRKDSELPLGQQLAVHIRSTVLRI